MKIFNVNRRYQNGVEVFESCNLNLSKLDLSIIVESLDKAKINDPIMAEQRIVLVTSLKPFV